MKIYLAIFLLLSIIIIFTFLSCYFHIKEGMLTNSTSYMDSTDSTVNSPNTYVLNSSVGIMDTPPPPPMASDFAVNNASIINSNQDAANLNTCDSSSLYKIKNIVKDENGNVIVRHLDTCGLYNTQTYTQSLNYTAATTQPPNTQPPTTQPHTTQPIVQPLIAQPYNYQTIPPNIQDRSNSSINIKIDSDTINQLVSAAIQNLQGLNNVNTSNLSPQIITSVPEQPAIEQNQPAPIQ